VDSPAVGAQDQCRRFERDVEIHGRGRTALGGQGQGGRFVERRFDGRERGARLRGRP
jgi:hypothetical protein